MKVWIAIKFTLALILGASILAGFEDMIFKGHGFGKVIYLISAWIWCSYVWNFYYPAKKIEEDKNDVDFKDL